MHIEHTLTGIVLGGVVTGLGLGTYFYRRLQKQMKKQSYQLATIEQLYNEVQRASKTIDRNIIDYTQTMVRALEARDSYTRGHSDRVNRYSMAIGQALGLSKRDLKILDEASLLHDIGKIGVYDRILLKPAQLDAEEFEIMKSHPDLAHDMLKALPVFAEHIPLIQHHHERQDGSGYPHGLRGDEIPLGARIIQVADTWDAMTSDRPYRRRMSTEIATEQILKSAGTQLDSNCVNAFIDWMKTSGRIRIAPTEFLN